MIEFQQKRKIRRVLYSPITLLLFTIIAVVFVRAAWNVYTKETASRDYLNQAQDELAKVNVTEDGLSRSVASLQTQQGIEADIRHKFHVVKPGEQIAVIVGDAATSSVATTTVLSTWQKLMRLFGI